MHVAGEGRKACAWEEWRWACLQVQSLGLEMFADALDFEKGVSPAGLKSSAL